MAFNFGSFGGGLISGAGAGSAFGPIGAGIGAAIGGISSLFGGGGSGGTQFLPSELMQQYMDIGLAGVKPDKYAKRVFRQDFKNLVRTGDRGAAEDMYRTLAELYPTEKHFNQKLRNSLRKPVDLTSTGWDTANRIYENAGLGFTDDQFRSMANEAQRAGVRGSAQFGDFIKQNLMAQGKILTPYQQALAPIFGAPRRTEEGTYTNDYMWSR